MIQLFVDRWMAKQEEVRAKFAAKHPDDYKGIVRTVVEAIGADGYDDPDPERIHQIDDGDYQGTLVFVIGANGYQPSNYWAVMVSYGSCSVCDTLQALRGYDDEAPTVEQVTGYMTLALHIVQGLKPLGESYV
jgi:hypothetical protein